MIVVYCYAFVEVGMTQFLFECLCLGSGDGWLRNMGFLRGFWWKFVGFWFGSGKFLSVSALNSF